jgi:hypothetical protein
LISTAQTAGVSVDAYIELMMDERDTLASTLDRAAVRMKALSHDDLRAKIERGYLQSERGEVVDGETFAAGLVAEIDEMERKRLTG